MATPDDQLTRRNAIRETASSYLGLGLTESEIATLLLGDSLTLEQLAQERSLTELGTALIRLDTLRQIHRNTDNCPQGKKPSYLPSPPFEKCIPDGKSIDLRLHTDWLK